ncbi:hypothetical protein B0H19DRAFT_1244303 [Mycena capillaripes]|nr:hypothetical protein B0H19DRAFT_1244303 [Mycena capillaripes]
MFSVCALPNRAPCHGADPSLGISFTIPGCNPRRPALCESFEVKPPEFQAAFWGQFLDNENKAVDMFTDISLRNLDQSTPLPEGRVFHFSVETHILSSWPRMKRRGAPPTPRSETTPITPLYFHDSKKNIRTVRRKVFLESCVQAVSITQQPPQLVLYFRNFQKNGRIVRTDDLTRCGMSSSLALIPWNQPDANKAVAKIDENSRPEGGRWGLVLHALLNPSPGRTLDEVYRSLGKAAEKQANRVAYKLGLGPHVVASKIKASFGNGEERVQQLELLRSLAPPKLEKRCSKVMKYTLPTESGSTQRQAFKEIVELATLFPGLRFHFLHAKCLHGVTSMDDIAALWNRPTGSADDDWTFWQSFAANCIYDTDISAILEGSTVLDLFKCMEGTLSVIERLLVEHDSSALCIQYLGGILDLPGFWSEMSYTHAHVASKLYSAMVRVFKDIGVDVLTLGPLNESELPFDYEGLDFLSKTVLTGISNWFSQSDGEQPRAAELLPESSACPTTTLENILPTHYQDAKLHVTVNSDNETTEAPDTNHNHSLANLHCKNTSMTSVHTKTSDQDADDVESDDEDHEDAQSMGSSEASSENGAHVSAASEAESYYSDMQLVKYFHANDTYLTHPG